MDEQKIIGLETEHEVDQVQIADDVIAVIAEIAALEVDGIAGTTNGKGDFVQALSGKKRPKGIKIEVGEGEVFIDIAAVVKYGSKIQKVCLEAQEKVNYLYKDTDKWQRMCGVNIAHSGIFSSDRTIKEYATGIWGSTVMYKNL